MTILKDITLCARKHLLLRRFCINTLWYIMSQADVHWPNTLLSRRVLYVSSLLYIYVYNYFVTPFFNKWQCMRNKVQHLIRSLIFLMLVCCKNKKRSSSNEWCWKPASITVVNALVFGVINTEFDAYWILKIKDF